MPEGDTIFRTAKRLRAAVDGQSIVAAKSRRTDLDTERMAKVVLEKIEPRGKHLLMHLSSGDVIHSHMGMTGSWHIYRRGDSWRKPSSRAELVLSFERTECVCFTPEILELLSPLHLRQHPHLQRLGPDLLGESFAMDEALRRLRTSNSKPIGQAVMDQTLVSGIGNIYKSELLFLEGFDPFANVESFSDEQLTSLLQSARRLMRRNCGDGPRQTRFGRDGGLLWVYNRTNQACFRCATRIQMRHQGDLGRSTYWCSQCQSSNSS